MLMPDTWGQLLWRLLRIYLPLLVVGWLTHFIFLFLFIGSIIHIAWFYYQQRKLLNWLYVDKKLTPPEAAGSWQPVFYGIYQLVKRRLTRERELAQLMKSFRLGAESLPDAIVVFNPAGEIVWCNQLAVHLIGLKWPTDAGQTISNLIRQPEFVSYIRHRKFDRSIEIVSPIRADLRLECRVMPYGEQYLMIVRDITQQRKLDKMRKHFIANVSHELRTPLTVLRGYLEMFEDNEPPSAAAWGKAHSMMTNQARRMDHLVNQLLMLARIEAAPESEMHNGAIDVPSLLDNLKNEVQSLTADSNLSLRFDVEPGLGMVGNTEQMRSAFSNLVTNAVKYCEQPGEIMVSWKPCIGGALFQVADSGPGIAHEHLQRLTERFYRVDKNRSRDTGGSGLGLSIVKHALQHHQSELSIESTLGEGSCFSFIIPSELLSRLDKKGQALPELEPSE